MTKVDVVFIEDVGSKSFMVLAHGDYVHAHIDNSRSYTYLKIAIKGERLYKAFSANALKMGDEISVMYRTYAGETNILNIPKKLRHTTEGGWRYFSLRLT